MDNTGDTTSCWLFPPQRAANGQYCQLAFVSLTSSVPGVAGWSRACFIQCHVNAFEYLASITHAGPVVVRVIGSGRQGQGK